MFYYFTSSKQEIISVCFFAAQSYRQTVKHKYDATQKNSLIVGLWWILTGYNLSFSKGKAVRPHRNLKVPYQIVHFLLRGIRLNIMKAGKWHIVGCEWQYFWI